MALQDGKVLDQDLTLIITIKDNKRINIVYNEVFQLLEKLFFFRIL